MWLRMPQAHYYPGIAPIYRLTGFVQGCERLPFSIGDSAMNCKNESKYMIILFTENTYAMLETLARSFANNKLCYPVLYWNLIHYI